MVSEDQRGLYEKFKVSRTDGRDGPGGDKEGAEYFVLCDSHDPIAVACLQIIAEVLDHEGEPELAQDLETRVVRRIQDAVGVGIQHRELLRDLEARPKAQMVIKRWEQRMAKRFGARHDD